jgi:hypothetical protein
LARIKIGQGMTRARTPRQVTAVTLHYSDGSTEQVSIQQVPGFIEYDIDGNPSTTFVKVELTGIKYPKGSEYTSADGTTREATCNTGAKEIEFYEPHRSVGPASSHGCYIGIQDSFREGRRTWSDGSTVTYANWAAGEPSPGSGLGANTGENYGELDFRTVSRCNHGAGSANQQVSGEVSPIPPFINNRCC